MNYTDMIKEGKQVFDIEIAALGKTRDAIDDDFVGILRQVASCKGKVITTGIGNLGHVAANIASTLAGLGTPAFYLHPTEALYGDLGMISPEDIVLVICFDGEDDEIVRILPNIKMIGATLVGITSNPSSTLAKIADLVQIIPVFVGTDRFDLNSTINSTVLLCYGNSLAIVASKIYGFSEENYGIIHPGVSLGKKLLLKVGDLMASGDNNPFVNEGALLTEAIMVMSKKGLGVVSVVNGDNKLTGIITDGDLRRVIEQHTDIYAERVEGIMTINPKRTTPDRLAFEALNIINQYCINNLPVVDKSGCLVGTVTIQQIIKAGIVL